jgi:hypothetical protein
MSNKLGYKSNILKDWYLANKNFMDSLLEDPEFLASIAKCGIVQSFTTKEFCKKFDICKEDDYQNEKVRIPTNHELANFFQTIYHAGTTDQFYRYANFPSNLDVFIHSTFHYLFDVFKKGIFIYIKDGNINTFLPFSNISYRNDWGQNLKTTKGPFKTVLELEEKNHWNPNFIPEKYHTIIQKDANKWYANYCIFRNTIYKNGNLSSKDDEGDKSIVNFLQLLTDLCYDRNIPDVCFYISPRDFPILKKNRTHPYDRLYKGTHLPYLGSMYQVIEDIPIFSQSITDEYDDKLIPNDDDIVSILCNKKVLYNTNWSTKKNMAVFAGSATGCGTTPDNNPRLHLYEIAKTNSKIMDVRLVSLNEKIKVDENGYVKIIDKQKYPRMNKEYKEKNSLTPKEQAKFKYIIHVQGHVAAFRLTRELAYGSLILKVESDWKTWYSDKLVGWRVNDNSLAGRELRDSAHYIIINADLSNLVSTIQWCMENKRNDQICENIAQRSLQFYKTHFSSKKYMLDYMQQKLVSLSQQQQLLHKEVKGLIIIPFRDDSEYERQQQLNQLSNYFDENLDKTKLDYVVAVQHDNKPFNRGLLLNNEVTKNHEKFDYFIFHDVDLIPDTQLLSYYYEYPKSPIHLGYRGQRWSETTPGTNKKFIGGVLSMNKYDYYNVNGFPNDFWGWGKEDDALSYRLLINSIYVDIPPTGSVTDLENLTIEQKLEKLKANKEKNMTAREQLENDKTNWYNNGVKQIGRPD